MNAEPRTHTLCSQANPFWRLTAERLRERGGQYRSPSTLTDGRIQREELVCSMLRQAHQLTERDVSPF